VPKFLNLVSSSLPSMSGVLPTELANLENWYRSDLGITLNGSTVSAWADQSGNGRHATNGVAGRQPTYTTAAGLRGLPTLLFDGGDILSTAAFNMPRAMTLFVVMGALTSRGMMVEHGNGDGFYCYAAGNAAAAVFGTTGIGYHRAFQNPPTTWAPANSHIAVVYDEVNPPKLRAADAEITPTSTDGVAQAAQVRSKSLFIGARSGLLIPHNGQISEIILYSRALAPAEISVIELYLFKRYGV
jgi:hypothetical protein